MPTLRLGFNKNKNRHRNAARWYNKLSAGTDVRGFSISTDSHLYRAKDNTPTLGVLRLFTGKTTIPAYLNN